MRNDFKTIVARFIHCLNEQNWNDAKELLSADFVFESTVGTREPVEEFFAELQRLDLNYKVKKLFTEGDEVCVIFEFSFLGISFPGCCIYHINDRKIDHIKAIYDPRHLPEIEMY